MIDATGMGAFGRLALVVAALAVVACGKGDGDKSDDQGAKAPAGETDEATDKEQPVADKPAFDGAAFCTGVMPPAKLGEILGFEFELKEERSKPPAGVVHCSYMDKAMPPKATAMLIVDCRASVQNLEKHREAAKRLGDLGYEETTVGKGGAKIKMKAVDTRTQMFLHDKVPCMMQVSTNFIDEDHTDALVQLVYPALTEDNRPK